MGISNILFFLVCVVFLVFGACQLFIINARSKALYDVSLALMRFSGNYASMLAKAERESGINRRSLTVDEELICKHLMEAGLFFETPGSWLLSSTGELGLKAVDSEVKKSAISG